jgi:hypothetical protein
MDLTFCFIPLEVSHTLECTEILNSSGVLSINGHFCYSYLIPSGLGVV